MQRKRNSAPSGHQNAVERDRRERSGQRDDDDDGQDGPAGDGSFRFADWAII